MSKLYFKVASDWQEVVRLRTEISKLEAQIKSMDANKAPQAVAVLNSQMQQAKHQMNGMITEAAKAGAVMDNDFKSKIYQGSQSVNDFTQKIINQKAVVKDVEADVRRLGESYRSALKNNPLSASGKLSEYTSAKKALDEEKAALFGLTQEQANARLSVKKLRDEYALYRDESKETIQSNEGVGISLKKAFAVIGGVAAGKELISNIIRVRGEFQAADTAIQTLLGSKEKANALMSQVKEYAKISSLEFSDVTQATQMMLGFNIEAEKVPLYLRSIGDISMGETGKFNSLTLAFSQMSAAGKLMGQDLNQMINAGFNPLQQISDTTGKSIATLKDEMSKGAISAEMVQKAFVDATSAGGKFFGMSENASKTINGQLSMMQDAIDSTFNELGEKSEGAIMGGIQLTTKLVENYETVGKILSGLVITYGAYRTAVMLSTIATGKHTIAEVALTNVRVIARRAQMALNASMLANPYVLLATAVGGLITANMTLIDTNRQLKSAANEYNKIKEQAISKEQAHKQAIDDLLSITSNEKAATEDRKEALVALIQKYPAIFEKYKTEAEMLQHILDIKKEINDVDNKNSLSNPNKELDDVNKQIADLEKLAKQRYHGGRGLTNAENAKLSMLKNKRSELEGTINKQETDAILADLTGYSNSQIEAAIKDRERLLAKMQLKGVDKGIIKGNSILSGTFSKGELEGQKKLLEVEKESRSAEKKAASEWLSSYKKAYEDADKAYNDFLKSKQVMSEADRDKELKRLKEERDIAKTTYEGKGGSVSSNTKQENQAAKLREQQEKYNLLLDKQKREQERMKTDSLHELEQIEINALQEGSEKILRQRALNHQKELEAIKREAAEKQLKVIEEARSAFEANHDKNKGAFDAEEFVKSEPAKKQFAVFDKVAESKIKTEETKYNRGDDLKGLLDEHQDYTDKRLAIEEKYNNDLAILDEQRKIAIKNGNTQQVEQIDRAKAQAIKNKGKELMGMDYDKLKESPEYIRAFENLKDTSSETLNSLLSQFESAKGAAAKVLSPDQLREYTTTIQEIMDELDSRNPFQSLIDRQAELAKTERELAEAKKQLDAVNGGAKIITGVKSTTLEKDGKIKVENTYLTAEKALKKYNAAKDKSQAANNNFIKAEKAAKEKVDELGNAIKGIGDSIGGTSGEVISFIGDIALFSTETIDGITKVAQTGATAMSAVEKASVILGIISAGIQLMQQLNSILPTADSQYEKYADKIAEINKLTDAINEYRIAALEAQHAEEGWFSEDNLKNLRNYKELHDEVTQAYKDKAGESQAIYQNKSGGGWFTNSWNWILDNTYGKLYGVDFARKYEEGQIAAINNLRIETRSRKKGVLGSGIGGRSQKTEDLVSWAKNNGFGELFDNEGILNKDVANSILNQYGDKLVGQTKETLESLVELRGKYDEYIDQLHEYVSSLYEPLVDNFVDSLWDWFDTGKDALDSFKDYASDTFRDIVSDMMRTIVLEKVVGSFSNDIASLYEEYAKGAIDEAELMKRVAERTDGLVNNYEQNIPTLQNILGQVDGYLKNAGIDLEQSDSTSQSSTSKGFATMSQDTGNELNGRFTALQISGEETKNQNTLQTQSLNLLTVKADAILAVNTETRNIADEIRTIQVNSYLELQEIRENTGMSAKSLKAMESKLDKIESNTKALSSK